MSVLTQFFGSTRGSVSKEIEARVLIVDGGKGNGYQLCFRNCLGNYGSCSSNCRVAGDAGRVYELNTYLQPGAVCPITVGYGGTSAIRTARAYLSSPYQGCLLAAVWRQGDYGSLSSFSDLAGSSSTGRCTVPTGDGLCYSPVANTTLTKCVKLDITKQAVPISSYTGGGLYQEETWCGCVNYPYASCNITCFGRTYIWDTVPAPTVCGCTCYDPFSMKTVSNALRNSDGGIDDNILLLESYQYQCNYARGVGYVSDITGCLCVYGSGGIRGGSNRCLTPDYQATPSAFLCRCDVTFTGSGAGAPSLPTANGCPGIVVVQYPNDYGTATTSSPNVCDCSPLTPGYRTYKFYCPGSITLP